MLLVNYVQQNPKMLEQLNEVVEQANNELKIAGIDEVAVLSSRDPNEDGARAKLAMIQHLVALPGVEYFNNANDEVRTFPIEAHYGVHYDFFRTPYDWRLEMMELGPASTRQEAGRESPLHRAYRYAARNKADMPVVHLSFKCYDEQDYFVALERLGADGYVCGQYCESTYGRFSYWMLEEGPLREQGIWLKPRVNLREQKAREYREAELLRLAEVRQAAADLLNEEQP